MVSAVELFRANHGSAGSLIFHVKFSCAVQLSHAHGNWKLGKAQSGTLGTLYLLRHEQALADTYRTWQLFLPNSDKSGKVLKSF